MEILSWIDSDSVSKYFLPSGCQDMVQEMITVLDDVDKKYNLKISENQELINKLKVSEGTIQKIF